MLIIQDMWPKTAATSAKDYRKCHVVCMCRMAYHELHTVWFACKKASPFTFCIIKYRNCSAADSPCHPPEPMQTSRHHAEARGRSWALSQSCMGRHTALLQSSITTGVGLLRRDRHRCQCWRSNPTGWVAQAQTKAGRHAQSRGVPQARPCIIRRSNDQMNVDFQADSIPNDQLSTPTLKYHLKLPQTNARIRGLAAAWQRQRQSCIPTCSGLPEKSRQVRISSRPADAPAITSPECRSEC